MNINIEQYMHKLWSWNEQVQFGIKKKVKKIMEKKNL